ncbi:MAG: hypothetical protein RIS84_785 [Pseudomonadota bacterium]|jgi:hypothetical protein
MMKKLAVGLITLCCSLQSFAAEISLEGISAMGEKRLAHFSMDGSKVSLKEGDNIGEWVLAKVGKRSVFLRDPAATNVKDAPLTELFIHSPLPTVAAAAAAGKPSDAVVPPPGPHIIPDDQVPVGQRRVRTPFGDILIKDEPKSATNAMPQQTPPNPGNPFMMQAPMGK